MRSTHWIAAGALAIGLTVAAAAFAADGEPAKAGKFQANLINQSDECTVPSETTGGALPLPACPYSDFSGCTFGAKGQGKVAAKAKTDVALQLQLKGLENCPDGTVLQATASFRSNTNNCSSSDRCTTQTFTNFNIPGATCTVAKGGCKLKATLNGLVPGIITTGQNTSIELHRVGVVTGTNAAVAAAGVLVP